MRTHAHGRTTNSSSCGCFIIRLPQPHALHQGDRMQNAEYTLSRRSYVWPLLLLAVLALGGLYLVKWDPYVHKAFLTAAHHSLGPSLVSGTSAQAPAPSWQT